MKSLLCAFSLSLTATLFANDLKGEKAWLNHISTAPPGPYRTIRPVHITYALSWKRSLNAGKMDIYLTQPDPGFYLSRARGQSSGIAKAVFPYTFTGSAQTDVRSLKPMSFQFNDRLKTKSHDYSIQFPPNQIISQTNLTDQKTGKTTPYRHVFQFEKDVGMDLISAILYLRSQPLKSGDRHSLVVASFNKPYLTEFRVLGREPRRLRGTRYNTIKMDLGIKRIHKNMTTSDYDKIERATVWLSDDAYRLPVEFQGDIFVGYICARMIGRKWL